MLHSLVDSARLVSCVFLFKNILNCLYLVAISIIFAPKYRKERQKDYAFVRIEYR